MAQSEFVLEMLNISKEFPGVKALDQVSLRVRPGTVHALLGENGAGKSTLMKCLFGLYKEDAGEIYLDGQKFAIQSAREAMDKGISMIHQELHVNTHRNVMENIWLGRFPKRRLGPVKLVDERTMYQRTKELFDSLNLDIDPWTKVGDMSVSERQLMEIARAVSYHSKVIIMDEPTSSLTENEVAQLFHIIRDLKQRNVAIIYISHKIEEILRISDEVSILRDGKNVGTWKAEELTEDAIISHMVGRDLVDRFPPRENKPSDEVVLRVEGLTSPIPTSFREVSFELRQGEILGIGGLVGAQRTELIEALFGLRRVAKGKVYLKGQEVKIDSPITAKKLGMALLTEERRSTGIFPVLDVLENIAIANIHDYVKPNRLLDDKARKEDAADSVERLQVRTPGLKTLIQDLSGGNQQKVLLGRWLLTEPDIFLLDEPTRGIDVGAKYEFYTIMMELAKQGKSIIFISSEMPELIGMSDRIMVMCEGRLAGFVSREEATQERIMRLATQFMSA
ncbi:MAG: sugar ABC transporter ATP-binding protein [Bacillota bacterium]|nr:sugar ABC transporter ATP-binding protein [Bacillota bacterium]